MITSNDPDENPYTVPVSLSVTGAPDLSLDTYSIDYGEVFEGGEYIYELLVSSTGTDLLDISDIIVDGGEFDISASSLSLEPGEDTMLEVIFIPTSTGYQEGSITFYSNDPSDSVVAISLMGHGIIPPDIVVSTDTSSGPGIFLSANLLTGGVDIQSLYIINEGGSDLNWDLTISDLVDTSRGTITFTKEDFSNYTDPDTWDCITETVCLTRGDYQGLYNPLMDYDYNFSDIKNK